MKKEDINILINQAYYFLSLNRLNEAEEICLKILEIDDRNFTALDHLGFIKYFKNEFQEGLDFCNKSIEISPGHAYAHKGKGLHLVKLGRLEEGIDFLKKAITLDPDFIDPYYDLSLTLYEHNRPQEARKYIIKGAKRCKDKNMRKLFGKLFDLVEEKMKSR
ncbi:MAG: tetratricopeptide repeat protein [Candidatus Eremiobacterota bacterium]